VGSSGKIHHINASDGSLLATIDSPFGRSYQLAFDGASIWATNWASGLVYKIRPSDGTILDAFACPKHNCWGVTVGDVTLGSGSYSVSGNILYPNASGSASTVVTIYSDNYTTPYVSVQVVFRQDTASYLISNIESGTYYIRAFLDADHNRLYKGVDDIVGYPLGPMRLMVLHADVSGIDIQIGHNPPGTVRVEASLEPAGTSGTTFLDWGEGVLWVKTGSRVYRVDPVDGWVLSTLDLPSYPCRRGFAYGGGYIWAFAVGEGYAIDRIDKIDPATGKVIGQIPAPGENGMALAWDGAHLWATDHSTDLTYKLDPMDGRVLSSFQSKSYQVRGMCWDGTYLWQSAWLDNTLFRVDPVSGETVQAYVTPYNFLSGLACDGRRLWSGSEAYDDYVIYEIIPIDAGTHQDQ